MNVIFTAIFGPYEELKEPLIITPGWEYVCFTDQELTSTLWKICKVPITGDPTKRARDQKINGFAISQKSIWLDASFTINCNLNEFWEKHFISPMTVMPHPWRKNVYHEIEACIKNNRTNIDSLKKQEQVYREAGLPDTTPVIMSGLLMRENTPEVRKLCDLWWQQIDLSMRDQIGFAYSEWKLPGVAHRAIDPIDYRTSQEFIYKTHFNRR